MLHGSLPHPVRAPSSRISGRKNVATCAPLAWKAPTHSLTFGGPCFLLEKNPCRSSARHQRVPSPAKESSKPLGFGRSRPGTEAAYLVHARRAAPAVRVRCPSAQTELLHLPCSRWAWVSAKRQRQSICISLIHVICTQQRRPCLGIFRREVSARRDMLTEGPSMNLDMRISLSPTARRRLAGDQHPIISWAIGFVTLAHRKD